MTAPWVSYNKHNVVTMIPLVRSKGSPPRTNDPIATAEQKNNSGGGRGVGGVLDRRYVLDLTHDRSRMTMGGGGGNKKTDAIVIGILFPDFGDTPC